MSAANGLVTLDKEECCCAQHVSIHATSGPLGPCLYAETVVPLINSKGQAKYETIHSPKPALVKVMEEDGWFIEKCPGLTPTKRQSWIGHYCPSVKWKIHINEIHLEKYGVCQQCINEPPPGIIALWKMHNFDFIQAGGLDAIDVGEACSSA